MLTSYVVGFMIRPSTEQVLLIEKNRPTFQKGKWNGVGGKIEQHELPLQAMLREFYEETGVPTHAEMWQHTLTLVGCESLVFAFRALVDEFPTFRQTTDEPLGLHTLTSMLRPGGPSVLPNMKWILPLQSAMNVQFPLSIFYHYEPDALLVSTTRMSHALRTAASDDSAE
jgi:8-oxo-dGTP diphosphatase